MKKKAIDIIKAYFDSYAEKIGEGVHLIDTGLAREKLIEEIENTEDPDEWHKIEDGTPEERIDPTSNDFYLYPVTIEYDGVRCVRYYKFGRGHWWQGIQTMDSHVIAWKEPLQPYDGEGK